MQPEKVTVYLLLGSNLGDREKFLAEARFALGDLGEGLVAVSSIYETESWGMEGQPPYLNQAVALKTDLEPQVLLQRVLMIEASMGRVREGQWGNRTIDIDILYYSGLVVQSEDLRLPHPRLHLRNFVLYPLTEIAPEFVHPLLNKTNAEMLRESEDNLSVRKINPQ